MALRQRPDRLLPKSKRLCEYRVSPRMRHQNKTIKLGRTADHRRALLANQVCAFIEHQRIKTNLAKAKAVCHLSRLMKRLSTFDKIQPSITAFVLLSDRYKT